MFLFGKGAPKSKSLFRIYLRDITLWMDGCSDTADNGNRRMLGGVKARRTIVLDHDDGLALCLIRGPPALKHGAYLDKEVASLLRSQSLLCIQGGEQNLWGGRQAERACHATGSRTLEIL